MTLRADGAVGAELQGSLVPVPYRSRASFLNRNEVLPGPRIGPCRTWDALEVRIDTGSF
jgi:hypothetical protein